MAKRPTWYHYACEVRVKINGLPQYSQEGPHRFQLMLNSHMAAVTEHDYLGTFSDWEHLLETFDGVEKAGRLLS